VYMEYLLGRIFNFSFKSLTTLCSKNLVFIVLIVLMPTCSLIRYSIGSNTSIRRTSPRCNGTEEKLIDCKNVTGFTEAENCSAAASVVCRNQSSK